MAVTYVRDKEAAEEVVRAVEALGRRGVALRADTGDAGEAAGAVGQAAEALGGLDVVVNNAWGGVLGPLESLPLAEVDRVLAVECARRVPGVPAAAALIRRGGPHQA